jgi:mycothiol synthase
VRLLHQMRRTLPLPEELRAATRPITVAAYGPQDESGLLRVNNRAFAWHPDQGGWDQERLARRMAEPWFRVEDLLVHHTDGLVDGFCWTKVHAALADDEPDGPRPAAGEIFVIAADPDTHGTGLGRALTVAGLDHLSAQGLTLAILYVEADNDAAIALYERLGFRVHHSDAGYAPLQP